MDANRTDKHYEPLSSSNYSSQSAKRPAQEKFRCIICNKKTQSCCSGCKSVFYCSPNHQQLHWETHQFECNPNQAVIREESDRDTSSKQSPPASREREEVSVSQDEDTAELSEEKERKIRLAEAMKSYMGFDYEKAIINAKNVYELSLVIAEKQGEFDPYQIISDGMLLAKFLIHADKISAARQALLEVWALAQKYLPDSCVADSGMYRSKQGKSMGRFVCFSQDGSLSRENKKEIYEKIKRITSVLSSIAALFSATGDAVNCEAVYKRYGKVIENNFGQGSLEISNYLFLLGVFFLENKQYQKSMDCFKEVLVIREKYYGTENHETIADCHYNIAIIYKQTENLKKALSSLSIALKIRAKVIGEVSLPVAQVLELAAKIHFEEEVYKEAFAKFQDCFIIRKKILHNPKHSDIVRVKTFIHGLYQRMEEVVESNDANSKCKETCLQIKNQMEKSALYSDIIKEDEYPPKTRQKDDEFMKNIQDSDEDSPKKRKGSEGSNRKKDRSLLSGDVSELDLTERIAELEGGNKDNSNPKSATGSSVNVGEKSAGLSESKKKKV